MKQIRQIYYFLVLSFIVIIFSINPKKMLARTFEDQTSEISPSATLLANQHQREENPDKTESESNNGFSLDAGVAVLTGFLGWGLTSLTSFLISRSKLQTYLAVVINNHVKEINENKDWLSKVKDNTIKQGKVINLAALYTKDDLSKLTSVREQCLKMLTKKELVKLEKFTQRLNQAETLLDGFCKSLQEYKKGQKPLELSDVEYLNLKIDRIESYINSLPNKNQEIKEVKDLKDDYAGVIGAATLVTVKSATEPASVTDDQKQT